MNFYSFLSEYFTLSLAINDTCVYDRMKLLKWGKRRDFWLARKTPIGALCTRFNNRHTSEE